MTGKEIVTTTLIRPISMTFTEPIVLAIDLYIGLVYAILYSCVLHSAFIERRPDTDFDVVTLSRSRLFTLRVTVSSPETPTCPSLLCWLAV